MLRVGSPPTKCSLQITDRSLGSQGVLSLGLSFLFTNSVHFALDTDSFGKVKWRNGSLNPHIYGKKITNIKIGWIDTVTFYFVVLFEQDFPSTDIWLQGLSKLVIWSVPKVLKITYEKKFEIRFM